jgi:hypothetical protein
MGRCFSRIDRAGAEQSDTWVGKRREPLRDACQCRPRYPPSAPVRSWSGVEWNLGGSGQPASDGADDRAGVPRDEATDGGAGERPDDSG